MYAKYRLMLQTAGGGFVMAAANRIDSLPGQVMEWLENTSQGRSVYDDQVHAIVLYMFDQDKGHYVFGEKIPVSSRLNIIEKSKEL